MARSSFKLKIMLPTKVKEIVQIHHNYIYYTKNYPKPKTSCFTEYHVQVHMYAS